MHVTVLSNSMGGVFSFTTKLVEGLTSKGCYVNVFFLARSVETENLVPSERVKYYFLTLGHFVPDFVVLFHFLFHDHPDLIHINFASFGPLALFKKWVFRVPFVYTIHGLPQPWLEPSFLTRISYHLESSLLTYVAIKAVSVVSVSNFVKEEVGKRFGVLSEVIYHGIEVDKIEPRDRVKCRKQLGFQEKDLVILYVSKLHPYKDPLTLIRAMAQVLEKKMPARKLRLIMIGAGELDEDVEREVDRLDICEHINLLKRVGEKDLRAFFWAADMFVLTSVNEAFGITLLEALASGLPVIASDSGACPEVVGGGGVLFRQGDHFDLSDKILRLSSDDELMKKLGVEGINRARKYFSWDDKIRRYFTLFSGATSSRAHAS